MLETIKESIANLPSESFGEFYQKYIFDLEDEIIDHDISKANSAFKSIEDINEIVKGINRLTEELK